MRHYLLLDDTWAFAENLAEILRDSGDDATVITDGAEALALAKTACFDALLTGMKMPGMSGAAAVHHIEVLRARGFSCAVARSVLETERLSMVKPFAALVDLRMPGGPNGEALRRLRARYPDMPADVITAHPELAPLQDAAGVFSKPFRTETRLRTLEQAYAARRTSP